MRVQCFIIAILCILFQANVYGQESVEKDSIRLHNDSLMLHFNEGFISPRNLEISPSLEEVETESPLTLSPPVEKIEFKLHKPFYIPPYYTNPSPMFYGDYSTGGQIFPYFYGSGQQTTLPGIGRINQASFLFQYPLNDYFEIQAGLNATKYTFPMSVGQSVGASGALIYHPNDRFRISAFGSYTPANRYDFNRSAYGVTMGYDFTDRFGMEVGVQRYYDPQRGWQTVPIVAPYYKFNKFELGIDAGGILYEVVRSIIMNKRQSGSPVIMPPGK